MRLRSLRAATCLSAMVMLAGCGTITIPHARVEQPLFDPIPARVGIAYAPQTRRAVASDFLLRVDVSNASLALLRQAFAAMFTQVEELPGSPPWREIPPAVDGVIEVESIQPSLRIGNEAGGRLSMFQDAAVPDVFSIGYRICLYRPDGAQVRCWQPWAQRDHQRGLFECLNLRACVEPLAEGAIRDAIAGFMVAGHADPVLRDWSLPAAGGKATP